MKLINSMVILMVQAALIMLAVSLHAAEISPSERTAWEKEMAGRVEEAMERFLGPERAKAFIKAELDVRQTQLQRHGYAIRQEVDTASADVNKEPQQNNKRGISWLWPTVNNESNSKTYVLPGINVRNPAAIPQEQNTGLKGPVHGNELTERTTLLPGITVKKLSAVILVDAKITGRNLAEIDGLVKTILEIDPSRGDSFQIVRLPFAPVWQKIASSPNMILNTVKWSTLTASAMFAVSLMFLGLNGVNKTVRLVMASRREAHEIEMNLNTRAAIGLVNVSNSNQLNAPARELKKNLLNDTSESSGILLEKKHFAFINGTKAETMAKILEDENPETVALVLTNIEPKKAIGVLNQFSQARQAEIVLTMSKIDFVDTNKIKAVEEKIKNKLDSLVGGKEQTVAMLSRINSSARETILNALREKDTQLAKRLELEIFKFEDLMILTPAEVNLALSNVPQEEVSVALRGMPQEFVDTVVKALPKEAQKALRQWISLGHPQSLAKIEEMRGKIVEAAHKLEQEGRISRHISPASREVFGEIV